MTAEKDLVHFPAVETHLIRSRHVAQTFKIQVARPPRKRSETARLPVVYVTDGNFVFNIFKDISCILQVLEPQPLPFIVVGIGYPSDLLFSGMMLRLRDWSYPGYPKIDTKSIRVPYEGVLLVEEGTKDFGGSEDFQRFIGEELIPFIDDNYETISGDRTYFGHSGGGAFGLFTLFTQSRLFGNYIVSSPGLIYNGETTPGGYRYENYECMLQYARDFIASGKSLDGIKLYMSVGTEEEFEPALENWRLTSSFYRMAALMKKAAIPGLEFMAEAIPGETHQTIWPIAFMHGIQAVFGKRRIASLY